MGEMGALAVRVLRLAIRPPFSWAAEVIGDIAQSIRRCAIPLVLSHTVYLIGFGLILFGNILLDLGIPDRWAGVTHSSWAREIGTWITAMIFAGVVGSAVTADLGARKIREELDAMAVLGVDRVKQLVVPRVIGMTIALPLLALCSLLLVDVIAFLLAPARLGISHGVFLDGLANTIQPLDLWLAMLLKNAIIGFFVGVVACYKGLSARPGAEGVGRAVNETVVITFFGIWLFDVGFNLAYTVLFPQIVELRA